MDSFEYAPFDREKPFFRLLRILKRTGPDIVCDLFQASLEDREDAISYEALSYTWGSDETPKSIEVNQKRLPITENLFLALRHLRREDEDRVLWVDAVCINQEDPKERMHQVGQMGDMFKRAERVIFWLGEATPETHLVIHSLDCLYQRISKHPWKRWKASDPGWRDLWTMVQIQIVEEEPALSRADLEARQQVGFIELLTRPWFNRVWVIQEVANARAALVCCGTGSVTAQVFALAPSLLGIKLEEHCQAVLDIMPGPSRKDSWWSHKHDLFALLLRFRKSQAKIPRDRIYALLGLASDANISELSADYEKSEDDVVRDVIGFLCGGQSPSLGNLGYSDITSLLDGIKPVFDRALDSLAKGSTLAQVQKLIRLREPDINITSQTLEAAAANEAGDCAAKLVEFFIGSYGDSVTITRTMLWSVLSNTSARNDIIDTIIRWRYDECWHLLLQLIRDSRWKDWKGPSSRNTGFFASQTDGLFVAPFLPAREKRDPGVSRASSGGFRVGLTEFILKLRDEEFTISLPSEIALYHPSFLVDIVHRRRPSAVFMDKLINHIAGLHFECREYQAMESLLDSPGARIHLETLVIAASRLSARMIVILLQKRDTGIPFAEPVLVAAAGNPSSSVMEYLLEAWHEQLNVTESVLVTAVGASSEPKIVRLLVDNKGRMGGTGVEITTTVLLAVLEGYYLESHKPGSWLQKARMEKSLEKLEFLLGLPDIQITEPLLLSAIDRHGKYEYEEETGPLKLIMEKKGSSVKITEAIIAAARSKDDGNALEVILKSRGGVKLPVEPLEERFREQVHVPEWIVLAVVERNGLNVFRFLLRRRLVTVTRKIVLAAQKTRERLQEGSMEEPADVLSQLLLYEPHETEKWLQI